MLTNDIKVANKLFTYCFAIFLFISNGCAKKALEPKGYIDWIENPSNGLRVSKTIGTYTFRLLYQPHDYMALRRLKNQQVIPDSIKSINAQLGNLQYYILRVQAKNGEELMREGIRDDMEYYQRMEYFTGPMQDDVSLVDGKDTLACVLFHFERNYGLAPYNDFLLGFESGSNASTNSDKTLLYDDDVLGTGPIHLTISGEDIKNIPTLLTE